MISTLFFYYFRLLSRNSKASFYFVTTFIIYVVLLGLLVFLQSIDKRHFFIHELLIFSYLFQFYYNFMYYGLGWESSFRYFVVVHLKVKNLVYMSLSINFLCFIFSFLTMNLVSLTTLLTINYSTLNILILYFFIPNLLFVFVFPLLTIHIDLFSSKGSLIIHKFYAFPLLFLTLVIPATLQYLWSNFLYGPNLVSAGAFVLTLIVLFKFSWIIKFWERKLLEIIPD
jgi:hypothetical protein